MESSWNVIGKIQQGRIERGYFSNIVLRCQKLPNEVSFYVHFYQVSERRKTHCIFTRVKSEGKVQFYGVGIYEKEDFISIYSGQIISFFIVFIIRLILIFYSANKHAIEEL